MNQSITINQFILVETGTYNDMPYRPFTANADPQHITALQEAVNAHSGDSTGIGLAGVAGQIVMPSNDPLLSAGPVNIQNGFNERRFAFMLEVEIASNFNTRVKEVIAGYSNYVGASLQGTLDPRMELIPNSVTQLREVVEDRGYGLVTLWIPVDNSQILMGDYSPSFANANMMPSTMRPMDVFDTVGMTSMPNDALRIDQRTTLSEGMRKSRRTNNLAPSYLARLLNVANQAFVNDDSNGDQPTVMSFAAETAKEHLISTDVFLGELQRRGAFMPNHAFLLETIMKMDPQLSNSADTRMHVVFKSSHGQQTSAGSHERGMTEHWNGSTHHTCFANILAHAVPALMTENLLTKVHITFTNRTVDGRFNITVDHDANNEGINGFIRDMDISTFVQRFFFRLENEVLRDMTMNGLIDIAVSMRCSIMTETWIRIDVGGQGHVNYVFPSFCDAMMAPVMSPMQQPLHALAGNIGALFNTINMNRPELVPRAPGNHEAVYMPTPSQQYGGNDYGTSGSL